MTIFDDIGRGFQQFGKDVERGVNQLFKPPSAHQVQQTQKFFNDLGNALQPKNVIHEFNSQIVKPIIQEVGSTERTIVRETGNTLNTAVQVATPIVSNVSKGLGEAFGNAVGGLGKGLGIDPQMLIIGGAVIGAVLLISVIKK